MTAVGELDGVLGVVAWVVVAVCPLVVAVPVVGWVRRRRRPG